MTASASRQGRRRRTQTFCARSSASRDVARSQPLTGCSQATTRSTKASARLRPTRGTDGTVPAVYTAGTAPYLLWFPQSAGASERFTLVPRRQMESEQQTAGRDQIAAPSHIIERPRLIKLMEESGARVIVLHAPAGYGKTTLARQWLSRQEEPVAWYRCSPSSSDVAVVVHGLADAMRGVLPMAGARALERLRDSAKPDEETSLLAELLASDLADWPSGAWLVIDDYHYLEEAPAVASSFRAGTPRRGAENPRHLETPSYLGDCAPDRLRRDP